MTKILVTGGGGYIGSNACKQLLENGYELVVIDNFFSGYRQPLKLLVKQYGPARIRYYTQDICNNLDSILEKETNIKAVIHYAGVCSVNESMQNPYKYFYVNANGTNNLLNHMVKFGIKNIVFSSSSTVYGETKQTLIDESHTTIPSSPYGQSKLMSEQIIQWFNKSLNINFMILRYFNVCGASDDGNFGDAKNPSVHLIQNAVRSSMGIETFNLTCSRVNTKDRTPIRDYVNVVDLNIAHLKALELLLKGKGNQIINLGTGIGYSVLEIIETVQKTTGSKLKVSKSISRKGECAQAVASNQKAKRILRWRPKRSLEDSIRTLMKWYSVRPKGWI